MRKEQLLFLLRSLEGKKILLAQQESPRRGFSDRENQWIQAVTGEMPAIRGLDFIHDDYEGVVERCKRWRDLGGIVTICWHTGVEGNTYPASKEENPDWGKLLTCGTKEWDLLRRRWDQAAGALRQLQEEEIPVLWRPFHEFDGKWFWWGKGGEDAFRFLWKNMHDCFEKEHGLHNLIWVLGYADDVLPEWDVEPDLFDIAGSDTYRGETVHKEAYQRLKQRYPGKLLAFHECGLIPPAEIFFEENCPWSWIMPWHGNNLMSNHPDRIREIYHDGRMISLSRLQQIQNNDIQEVDGGSI